MNDTSPWNEDQEEDFDLLGTLFKFFRHWYWYVLAVGICFVGAFFYLKKYTPIYQVTATVLIKDDHSNRKKQGTIVDQLDMGDSKNIDNEMEILKSRPLIEKIVDNLGLTVTYLHEGRNRDVEIYKDSPVKVDVTKILSGEAFFIQPLDGNKYEILDEDKNTIKTFIYSQKVRSPYGEFRVFKRDSTANAETTPVKIYFQNKESVTSGLIGAIEVSPKIEWGSLISLSITNAVPQKGKDILQNLLDEYAFSTLEDKNREATNTLRFIEERLKIVTSELGDVEQNVEQYRSSRGITDLSSEATLFLDKVQENDSKLNEIDINLRILEGVEKTVNSNQLGDKDAPALLGVSDPTLTNYLDRMAELEQERTKLAQTVQTGNPYLETINTQMRNVKQAIQENLRNQRTGLQVTKNSLLSLNNRLAGSISTIPRKEREFLDIKRQAGVKENLYLLLLEKREETALSYASTITDSRITNPPYANPGPIAPVKNTIYMYALLLGLLVPTLIIFLKETLNNSVQSKKEIESKTGMQVFGEISVLRKSQIGQTIDLNSRSFISEQIRMIRSNMQYLFTDGDPGLGKSVIITSSTAGEGKSFVALNIAVSLALLNKKVIILGLDLRKPKINEYLDSDNRIGLSNYLIGQAKESDIIKATQYDNVYIAPSGPIPPNPSELLATNRIENLVASLREKFDYIVIDTPPIGLVTDTILLAPLADATFYIVRYDKTPKLYLNTISDLNKRKVFKSLNIIFNAVNYKNSSEYGYGYGYGYGSGSYGNGNGYYGDSDKSWLSSKLNGNMKMFKKKKSTEV